ncbi:MAG: hypothetical protein OXF23_06955 [Candidatus Dadabacteria bacterium]|nr:hypothetical protein [Candidatus Dadabacteria bacterium]
MSRLSLLFVLALLLVEGSCGDAEEHNTLVLVDDYLASSQFTDAYKITNTNKEYEDDEYLYEEGIDCSAPGFTHRETLPSEGTQPEALITNGNNHWECEEGIERYHADGTLSGIWEDDYEDILDFWNVCRVGTSPPNFGGRWNVTRLQDQDLDLICARIDIMPGVVFCSDFAISQDGLAYTLGATREFLVIHKGEVIDTLETEPDTCHLREE